MARISGSGQPTAVRFRADRGQQGRAKRGHQGRAGRLLLVLLGATLLGGCQASGVSEAGRERCRQRGAAAGDPVTGALTYMRCLPTTDRSLAIEKAAARKADARQAALEACRSRRERITSLMASLRQAEQELAAARNTSFRPSLPPPTWDPGRESRYRLEDQQLDRERYEAALDAWERRVAPGTRQLAGAEGPAHRCRPEPARQGLPEPQKPPARSVHRCREHRIQPHSRAKGGRRLREHGLSERLEARQRRRKEGSRIHRPGWMGARVAFGADRQEARI